MPACLFPYECGQCAKLFDTKAACRRHMRRVKSCTGHEIVTRSKYFAGSTQIYYDDDVDNTTSTFNQLQFPKSGFESTYMALQDLSQPIEAANPIPQPSNPAPTPPFPVQTAHSTMPNVFDLSQPFTVWNPWLGDFEIWNSSADQCNINPSITPIAPSIAPPIAPIAPPVAPPIPIAPIIPISEPILDAPHDPNEPYLRVVRDGRIIYQHPTAGQSFGKGRTPWEIERNRNEELRGGNQWAMWNTQDEWETVKWMATTKYKGAGYSFKNAKQLFKKIQDQMGEFGGPEWHAEDILIPHAHKDDRVTLFFCDLEKCADFIFGRPWFAGKMSFGPERHYNEDETTRLYENPWTADYWNDRQKTLPRGTTLGGMILASDATQLSTHSGDVSAHALYMSLANIDKSVRAKTSEDAWILVAYIPKSKFQRTMATLERRPKAVRSKILGVLNRRLFHRCMEIITQPLRRPEPHKVVDPEGYVRSVLYELIGYVADLEEQWMLAGLGVQTCPHCECDPTQLGDAACAAPQTRESILKRIEKIKTNYKAAYKHSPSLEEYMNLASEQHLNGVDKPFWESLPGLNICEVLCPDLLHGFHKFFYDHIY
ncbi:hypothetical protein FRC07_006660 [Ceratobasidium sp. 392]|nr:hypothetical protein FRC07_006660 [Ceratobasidium sp. 392]